MIKADIFVKLTGVTTTEQADGSYNVDAPCILYYDQEKTVEIARVTLNFENLSLEQLDLQSIYGLIMQKFSNPFVI